MRLAPKVGYLNWTGKYSTFCYSKISFLPITHFSPTTLEVSAKSWFVHLSSVLIHLISSHIRLPPPTHTHDSSWIKRAMWPMIVCSAIRRYILPPKFVLPPKCVLAPKVGSSNTTGKISVLTRHETVIHAQSPRAFFAPPSTHSQPSSHTTSANLLRGMSTNF